MPGPLEVQYIEVTENPVLLQPFNLKAKCIMCERTLVMSKRTLINFGVLWYKIQKSLAETFLALFLVLMISIFSMIEEEFLHNSEFLSLE